jgi:hypothetical protein
MRLRRSWGHRGTGDPFRRSYTLLWGILDRHVHELLHLKYRDHGKQFKAMMTALVPNWRELEQISRHWTERQVE